MFRSHCNVRAVCVPSCHLHACERWPRGPLTRCFGQGWNHHQNPPRPTFLPRPAGGRRRRTWAFRLGKDPPTTRSEKKIEPASSQWTNRPSNRVRVTTRRGAGEQPGGEPASLLQLVDASQELGPGLSCTTSKWKTCHAHVAWGDVGGGLGGVVGSIPTLSLHFLRWTVLFGRVRFVLQSQSLLFDWSNIMIGLQAL